MAQLNITLDTKLLHGLFTKDTKDEAFSKRLEAILNQVLLTQSAEQLGTQPYERSEIVQRTAMAYRPRADYSYWFYNSSNTSAQRESETSWGDFFSDLKTRGLTDVDLIASDNHKGLVNAIKKHF